MKPYIDGRYLSVREKTITYDKVNRIKVKEIGNEEQLKGA